MLPRSSFWKIETWFHRLEKYLIKICITIDIFDFYVSFFEKGATAAIRLGIFLEGDINVYPRGM